MNEETKKYSQNSYPSEPRYALPSPNSSPCHNFLDEDGQERIVSKIIVPTVISEREDGSIVIRWNCSMARSCYNGMCFYARGRRDE